MQTHMCHICHRTPWHPVRLDGCNHIYCYYELAPLFESKRFHVQVDAKGEPAALLVYAKPSLVCLVSGCGKIGHAILDADATICRAIEKEHGPYPIHCDGYRCKSLTRTTEKALKHARLCTKLWLVCPCCENLIDLPAAIGSNSMADVKQNAAVLSDHVLSGVCIFDMD